MKYIAALACLIVALHCVDAAIGDEVQHTIPADWLWVFWLLAAVWVCNGAACILTLRNRRA